MISPSKKRKKKRTKKIVSLRNPEWTKLSDSLKDEVGECEECHNPNRKILQAHHIKHVSTHPELELVKSNVQILCVYCHAKKHPEIKNFILAKQFKKHKKINSIFKALNRK